MYILEVDTFTQLYYNIHMVLVTISRLDPYPSDLSDRQWNFLVEEFPQLLDTKNARRLLDGILYKFTTGMAWTSVPRDLPSPVDMETFYSITKSTGFLDEIITYLGSNYSLSVGLVSRFRSRGLKLSFINPKVHLIEYGLDSRIR